MKDIKSLLKEAREAIKNKDYETSLKVSKSILREDKSNYMALVFLGLSFQEVGPTDQAPKAFLKAIEVNSTNPLAWNGLINYYEKLDNVESKKELVKLYSSAIDIETTEKKVIEYCQKLANLYEHGDICQIANKIFHSCKSDKISENKSSIYQILFSFFEQIKEVPSNLNSLHEETLLYLIENKGTLSSEYYAAYLMFLYKQNKYEDLFNYAEKMHKSFATDPRALVWICKIFNQLYIEDTETANKYCKKVSTFLVLLLEIEPKNSIGLFSQGVLLLQENKLLEAKDIIREVTTLRPGLLHAWILLTSIYSKLNLFEEAFKSSLTADKLLQSIGYSNKILKSLLDVLLIEILSKSSVEAQWKQALDLYNTFDSDLKNKCLEYIIRVNINLEKFVEAKLLILDLKAKNEAISRLLLAKLLGKQKQYQEALNLIGKDPVASSEWWIEIGILYWNLEEFEKSLVPFLKAAKCDPNNYLTFFYLGNYYQKFNDLDKARRCYEKAFKINPKSSHIGTELSKIYRRLKHWEANQTLLQTLTSGTISTSNAWAWLQLGLSYLEQEDYPNAINNLRFVVRIEPDNGHCWESLADAYFARGSYTSALKCYQKSLELTENILYPTLQIANIKKLLGEFPEARIDFEEILRSNGEYVPALKGLSETCMLQARECLRDQRLGTARDHVQTALEKLTLAIRQRSEFSCLWKLVADGCLLIARLPEKYCCLLISNDIFEGKNLEGNRIIEKEDLYVFATRCFCKAVSLTEENILIWHDLGVCYLHYALNTESPNKKQLFQYALAAARHCVLTNPTYWQHWNLLGTVAMSQDPPSYALAQHSFIKAVTADHNSAMSWCNLGIIYLLMNDIKLANKAFTQGQRSDPNYVNSWIGQAMIAEGMGHEEAMDLFRHTTQLGQHPQGGIGYAHWVCQTLLEAPPNAVIYAIHNMHAIPVACDALTWYTEKNPYDGCAWNMLGILRERMKLKESTLEAFRNAYRFAEKCYRDLARVNYGRILAKLGKYSEAIKIFQEVQEATFNSGSGLALVLFKDKQFGESYNAYEQALHWLTEEQSSQSDLLVALASMAYMFQGPDAAKTLLFQSIQLKPPSPWGLYATLSLGLLHKDLKLAKLVLNEMEILKDRSECLQHYAILLSCVYLLQGEHNKAVKEISKLIHRHPENPSVWLTLSILLLQRQDKFKPSPAAAKCAQVAMKFGQTNMDVTKILCLVSLASILNGKKKDALIFAQKAVHCYPNIAEGWAVLSSALLKTRNDHNSGVPCLEMLHHIENLNPSNSLLEWSRNQRSRYVKA